MKKTTNNIIWILLIMFLVLCGCIAYVLFEKTLISWWFPLSASLIAIAITFPFHDKWSSLVGGSSQLFNIMCHIVYMGIIGYSFLILGNYFFRDVNNPKEMKANIIEKYSKTTNRRKTHGRRHYHSTAKKQLYYIKIALENGQIKKFPVTQSLYNKTKGNTLNLVVEKGFFGFPVIQPKY